ncbi:MAG: MFS transporter, partial [Clostridiales Family XIII bacterium]|nr:MFS transporter [Clostridiales Family XIII bacterium]
MSVKSGKNRRADWRTTGKERVSYYLGDNAKSMEGQLVQIFMMTFLLFSGVNLVAVATVTLAVKVIDALDDVIFGYFVDRIKPNQIRVLAKIAGNGRYLPWYRLTFWMFPLATVLLFRMPQGVGDWVKIAWFAFFYFLYDLTFTLIDIPMNAVVMTITSNPEERNAIVTNKMIITVILIIVSVPLMNFMISEYVGMSIPNVALVMSIIFVAMMLPLVFVTKEHNVNAEVEKNEKYTLKEMFINLKSNKFLMYLFISNILYGCFRSGDAIILFASYYLYGNSQVLMIPVLIALIPTVIMQKYTETLCRKYDKYKVALIAQSVHFALRLLIFIIGYRYLPLHVGLLVVTAIPSITHEMSTRYMVLDCIEYGKFKSGKECAGITFALSSFISKVSLSVASSLCMIILGIFGWVAINAESFAEIAEKNITQPPSALTGLWVVYAGTWVVGIGLCLIFLAFYRLKNKDVA